MALDIGWVADVFCLMFEGYNIPSKPYMAPILDWLVSQNDAVWMLDTGQTARENWCAVEPLPEKAASGA